MKLDNLTVKLKTFNRLMIKISIGISVLIHLKWFMLWYCFRLKFIDLCSNKLTGLPSPPSWKSTMLKEVLVSRNQINKVIRTLLSNDFHGIFIENKLACTLIWFLWNASIHIQLYDNIWQILSYLFFFTVLSFCF